MDPADIAIPDDLSYEEGMAETKQTEGPPVITDKSSREEEEDKKRLSLVNMQEINREREFFGYERGSEFAERELQRADLETRRWGDVTDSRSAKRGYVKIAKDKNKYKEDFDKYQLTDDERYYWCNLWNVANWRGKKAKLLEEEEEEEQEEKDQLGEAVDEDEQMRLDHEQMWLDSKREFPQEDWSEDYRYHLSNHINEQQYEDGWKTLGQELDDESYDPSNDVYQLHFGVWEEKPAEGVWEEKPGEGEGGVWEEKPGEEGEGGVWEEKPGEEGEEGEGWYEEEDSYNW